MGQDAINENKEQVNLHLDEEIIRIYAVIAPTKDTDRKKLMQDVLTEVALNLKKSHKTMFKEIDDDIDADSLIEKIAKKAK